MPKNNRRRAPFYRRRKPQPEYDIRQLRPPSLPKGKRFETLDDAREYSRLSEELLGSLPNCQDILAGCRDLDERCNQPYCPMCSRRFRIWFIDELFRIIHETGSPQVRILTVLLEQADRYHLLLLNIKRYDAILRKRLTRNGLGKIMVIGGYEIFYRAKAKTGLHPVQLTPA